MPAENFLPKTGHYRDLLAYRKSEIIYDLTLRFCEQCLKRGDRTIDKMVQAARSGKQNFAEGCKAYRDAAPTALWRCLMLVLQRCRAYGAHTYRGYNRHSEAP